MAEAMESGPLWAKPIAHLPNKILPAKSA